jgi:GT2 family glycosyltransferase
MIKYGFVVLNYINFNDTIECVLSLLTVERDDYVIAVVDNFSENESMDVLHEHFSDNTKVHLLSAPSNLGYSGGNNIGIKYLSDMAVNRVIIATNDTVLLSKDILDKLDELDLSDVGIVGPNVLLIDGDLQNPSIIKPGLLYLLNLHCYSTMKYIRSSIYDKFNLVQKARISFINQTKTSVIPKQQSEITPDIIPVYMLHGCFLYLTEAYLYKIGCLDDNIFMYSEEDLMSWNCEKNKLSRLFVPSISVLHKERKSTKSVHSNKTNDFIENNTIKSRTYVVSQIKLLPLLRVILKISFCGLLKSGK